MLKDDPKEQVVYYQVTSLSFHAKSAILTCFCQPGIGTSTNHVFKIPIVTKLTDMMFAYSLDDHIKGLSVPRPVISPWLIDIPEGYKFLMRNC